MRRRGRRRPRWRGGADRLDGGTGDDLLQGGRGPDLFLFRAGFGNDAILGFDGAPEHRQGRIDLRGLGITGASFAADVTIARQGDDALASVAGEGTIRCLGVYGDGGTGLDPGDFLLLA